jgi:hypothetical protein
LRPDLDLGGTPGTEFGYIADAAVMRGGTMAVLDRLNAEVWLFSASGQPIKRFGGKGNGPGELHSPVAIAAVGHDWVVLEPRIRNTFTVYDSSGRYVTGFNAPLPGDWSVMGIGPAPAFPGINEGQENLADRLSAYDDTTIAAYVEDDATLAAVLGKEVPVDTPSVRIVRLGLHGQVLDTLAEMTGAPVVHRDTYYEPFYASRPVWGIGAGWITTTQGARAAIDVHFFDEGTATRIVWPAAHVAIDQDQRESTMRHFFAIQARGNAESARLMASHTPSEVAALEHQATQVWPFASEAPEITGAFSAGRCLWLAGWNSTDALDGTASTWVVLDLRTDSIVRVVRIPRPDSRVRVVSPTAVYTTYMDSLGVGHLERYPAPMPGCAVAA